jgi:hypothetical protein
MNKPALPVLECAGDTAQYCMRVPGRPLHRSDKPDGAGVAFMHSTSTLGI